MMSISSSKVKSNNIKDFIKYINDGKKLDEYTTEVSFQYNLNLQLFKSDTSNGIVQVHPDTVLKSMGMSDQEGLMMGDVWVEMFENEEMNNQLYEVVSGRMPKKYNEVVLLMDENNRVTDYVLYAIGLKDQKELEVMMKDIMAGKEIESKAVSYSYAITCHKIQGGENDCVIINSLDFNRCRDRKVLEQLRYVGATRAKKALIVLK